jgi:hypothetical protein
MDFPKYYAAYLPPLDTSKLSFSKLAERRSEVTLEDLGEPCQPGQDVVTWLGKFPNAPGTRQLRWLLEILTSRVGFSSPPVAVGLGGHVIKTGCGPYIVDLLRRRLIKSVALTGSAAIHDIELALAGHTSEYVAFGLSTGTYGFTEETSRFFAEAVCDATKYGTLGSALGYKLQGQSARLAYKDSVLQTAASLGVPVTVHIAVGTDVVHMNPWLDPAQLGVAAHADFVTFCQVVLGLRGGVYINMGSDVILPEVFLKALATARNLDTTFKLAATADFDFERKYRPTENVLSRHGGPGYAITGSHEFMIPLFHAALTAKCPGVCVPEFERCK